MIKSLLVVAGLSALAGTASADSKSWTALKGKLPRKTIVVGGVDVAAIRATPSFGKLIEWVSTEHKDVGELLGVVKATCGMELPAMISDVAFSVNKHGDGLVVVQLAGTDQKQLTACAGKVITKLAPDQKLVASPIDKFTEYKLGRADGRYQMTKGSDQLRVQWLAGDLVAIALGDGSGGALYEMAEGSPADGDLATNIGLAGTAATAWAAFTPKDDDLKGGWGTLVVGSTIKLALRLTAATPKEGDKGRKEMKDKAKNGIERSAKQPELKKAFQALKVGGKGAEVTIDLAVPEASLPALFPAFDKVF